MRPYEVEGKRRMESEECEALGGWSKRNVRPYEVEGKRRME